MNAFQDYEEDLLGEDRIGTLINFSIRYGFNDDFAKHKLYFLSRVWIEFLKKLEDEDDTVSISSCSTYLSELEELTQILDPYEIAKRDLGYSLEDSLSLSAFGY